MKFAALALYAPIFVSAVGAFAMAAALMRSLGVVSFLVYASLSFLAAGAVWKRCQTIWSGRAERLWIDVAGAVLFLALLVAAGRGFGTR